MNGTATDVENNVEELILNSRAEFEKRRWILITNVSDGVDLEDLKQNFLQGFDVIDLRIDKNSVFILLGTPDQAISAINSLNGQSLNGYVVGVSLAPPDSLLFVGNLPFDFTEEQFRNLMNPFGPIERLFLVRSVFTGESKGFGFVDYINRESATQAKQQLMSKASKYVGGRILRVDFAEANLLTYEDLHSKTLFVDRLPRDFTNAEMLRDLFGQSGTVTFAQVAVNNQGISRGFAFVDYMTAEEAERGQKAHNGALLEDSHIRVAYGTPGRTGFSILGSHHNPSGGGHQHGPFGPRPRGPNPHAPQGVDMMGARGPRPLMAPRPLMGSEPWQQMPRGHLGKSLRPLMRHGPPGPRPMMGRLRGPSPGGPRGALLGHGPRPLLGRPPGPRPLIRHPGGPRGFVGVGVGGPPGTRPMAPRGPPTQPRPLMDFGEQLDATVYPPDQMHMQAVPVAAEPAQQYTGDTLPALMGEPTGGFPPAVDPGLYGQTVQPMVQPQEGMVPPAQQPQGMIVPSQPQPGPRAGVPQMMQVQPVPATPVAAYTGALPAAAPTQPAVIPQAQPSLLVPTQQQVPNSQVLYASAPGAVPGQGMVPPVVPQDPAQYQAGVLPTNHGMTPGATAVAGQTDLSAAPYGIPGMQPVAQGDPTGSAAVSSGYVVFSSDATQQTGFYAPQETQPYQMPQYTTAGQPAAPQSLVQLPVGVQPANVMQTQVSASQPSGIPMVTPQAPQYQWYQQVAPAVGTAPVSTPQLTQNQPLQVASLGASQWPQGDLVASSQQVATVQTGGIQYQPQQGATPGTEAVMYYQQPQQQQQQQQPGMYPSLMETAPPAAPQAYPTMAAVSSNEHAVYPNASVAPQHSAPPVVYNSQQPTQLVAPGGPSQMSQKRAADGDAGQYGQQGPPAYYDANKRLRY